jgi:hypothetical protein
VRGRHAESVRSWVDDRVFTFARNNVLLGGETRGISGDFRASEFAGATYSPDGKWLFLNVQSPGITFAITGPGLTASSSSVELRRCEIDVRCAEARNHGNPFCVPCSVFPCFRASFVDRVFSILSGGRTNFA